MFGEHLGSPGLPFLQSGACLAAATTADSLSLIAQLGGKPHANIHSFSQELLGEQQRRGLMAWLDRGLVSPPPVDWRVTVTQQQLGEVLGEHTVERLLARFGGQCDAIRLRRVTAQIPAQCVPFHTDHARRVLQIPLNADFEGGELVFATGHGLFAPSRPPGSATLHTHTAVHGVAALRSGVRYSLFLCDTNSAVNEGPGLQAVLASALQDLTRERAEPGDPTESELQHGLEQYACFFPQLTRAQAMQGLSVQGAEGTQEGRESIAAPPPSVGVELFWRTHMLHPQLYRRACEASIDHKHAHVTSAAVDLVAAARRQAAFMRGILTCTRNVLSLQVTLESCLSEYRAFLMQMRESAVPVSPPSILVDFLWHTHMMCPDAYARDCEALVGMQLDHCVN